MTPARYADATAALVVEWGKAESWIESQRRAGFVVNGVELSGEHITWLALEIGDGIGELLGLGADGRAARDVASAARLRCELLRAVLTSATVADPSGMRQAARRAYTVARMLRELVGELGATARADAYVIRAAGALDSLRTLATAIDAANPDVG